MKNFIFAITTFMILSNCDSDVNKPVHDFNTPEIFSCNWIVIMDVWGDPVAHKCWAIKPIYLEEFDITPNIAKQIIITYTDDTSEALIENSQGLEIIYDISDSSKVAYEKTYQKFHIK